MDAAVGLVEAYLRVNGYFTVAEYPVLEAEPGGGVRTATDLDVLAFRFPGAGRRVAGEVGGAARRFEPDPALGCPPEHADMLIGEVKEGRPRLNPALHDPEVLRVALARFGCCPPEEAPRLARRLLRKGSVGLSGTGHRARIVAFGTGGGEQGARAHTVVDLGHVIRFLRQHLREQWAALRHAQLKDGSLALIALLEKAQCERDHVRFGTR